MIVQCLIPYALALIINDQHEVLLTYRTNTQWFNNHYGLVGGKIENNESATHALARELLEEVGITVSPAQAEFVHIMHFKGETEPCIALFFVIRKWAGKLTNIEKDKHAQLAWFDLDKLPDNLIPRHRKAIDRIGKHLFYSEEDW